LDEPTLYQNLNSLLYSTNSLVILPNTGIDPSQIMSGTQISTVSQNLGSSATGKTKFDNSETGYILGLDSGVAKFYIGNTTSYLNWTGSALIISGYLQASSIDIPNSSTANSFHVDTAGNAWWGAVLIAGATAKVLNTGAATFSNMTITGGAIAGWTIGATALYSGTGTSRVELDTLNGIYLGDNNFASAPFSVALNGAMTATNATISGSITATSGTIGGVIKTAATVSAGSTGVIMDTAGLRGYDSVLGQTFNLPTDGSAPYFSSGVINTTVFNVDTEGVIRTSSTVGDGSSSSAGILINNTGLYGCAANQLLANANVKVLINGTAVFNASVMGGQTDFNTGTGYFLGLSGGNYKFSIGSPTNYMTWDGTYLKLLGSFNVGANGLINNSVYTVANLPISPTTIGFNAPSSFLNSMTTTPFLTPAGILSNDSSRPYTLIYLTATTFVVSYRNTNGYAYCVVGTISGGAITYGTPTVVVAATVDFTPYLTLVDSTHFVVSYGNNSGYGWCAFGTVSAGNISFGTPAAVVAGSSSTPNCASILIDSTHFVVSYIISGAVGYSVVGTISGTNISFGTPTVILTATTSRPLSQTLVDSTHFVVGYVDTNSYGWCVVGTIAAGAITFGTAKAIVASTVSYNINLTLVDSTHFVLAYNNTSNYGFCVIGTIAAGAITWGTAKAILTSSYSDPTTITLIDSTHFLLGYYNSANYGFCVIGTISSGAITWGTPTAIVASSYSPPTSILVVDPTHIVVSYYNSSLYGFCVVGNMGFTNPTNIYAQDGSYTTFPVSNGNLSIQISGDGGVTWQNTITQTMTGSDSLITWGAGATELWGSSWTRANMINGNLQLKLSQGSYSQIFTTYGFATGSDILTGIEVAVYGHYTSSILYLDLLEVKIHYGSSILPVQAGSQAFASNGRKNGEGAGSGTGVLVYYDGSNWIASDTGQTVAA
jgi:hypothetical protein